MILGVVDIRGVRFYLLFIVKHVPFVLSWQCFDRINHHFVSNVLVIVSKN